MGRLGDFGEDERRERDETALEMIRDGVATVSEVAALLGTSRQRVYHWCRVGFNPGRRAYEQAPWAFEPKGRPGRPYDGFDPKAARKQWLAAEFETRQLARAEPSHPED
jgi:hypothetical protein